MDYTDRPRPVADPWYTDDFETAYRDIREGCQCLLEHLTGK
jgi:protein-tyrosine phosphatase